MGRPEGGQFTGLAKPGAEVSLDLSDEAYNADGTYLFPPIPRSVEQHIAFWEKVPIHDEVMSNVAVQYKHNREEQVTQACERAAEAWKEENPDPTLPHMPRIKDKDYHRVVQTWKDKGRAVWDETEAREQAARPAGIPHTHMRTILRAHGMTHYAHVIGDEAVDQVVQHELPWNADETASVGWINDTYRLWEIGDETRTPMR
ncbi:hypothetical protein [Pseudactinotalea sp. Z1748]|uniref:hypothetical protein n=1 Tax=Pseudactinotalea sp. Z1748 TaxID=3413027 RepID=UPI003C7ED9D4